MLGFLKSFAVTPSELEEGHDRGHGVRRLVHRGVCPDSGKRHDRQTGPHHLPACALERRGTARGPDVLRHPQPGRNPLSRGIRGYVFKRLSQKVAEKGYTFFIGPELEYLLSSRTTRSADFLDTGGYFDARPLDMGSDLRRDTIFALQSMGIQVEYSHHEVAPSQHEIDLRYDEGLRMADKTMTYRLVVKEIARQHGVYATFMPKPIFGQERERHARPPVPFQGRKERLS